MTAKLYQLPRPQKITGVRQSNESNANHGLEAYQLYVELDWVRPKVWRRLLVPIAIKLPSLHVALLWGTGWQGGHIYEFIFADANYGRIEPGWDLPDGVLDEGKRPTSTILAHG